MTIYLIWLAARRETVEVVVEGDVAVDSRQKARLAELFPGFEDRPGDKTFSEFLRFVEAEIRDEDVCIFEGNLPAGGAAMAPGASISARKWNRVRRRIRLEDVMPRWRRWLLRRRFRRRGEVGIEGLLMRPTSAIEDVRRFFQESRKVPGELWPSNAPRHERWVSGVDESSKTWSSSALLASHPIGKGLDSYRSHLLLSWEHEKPIESIESLVHLRGNRRLMVDSIFTEPTYTCWLGEGWPDFSFVAHCVQWIRHRCRHVWGQNLLVHVLEPHFRFFPGKELTREAWERAVTWKHYDYSWGTQEIDWIEPLMGQSRNVLLPRWASAALLALDILSGPHLVLIWFHDELEECIESTVRQAVFDLDWVAQASDHDVP
jgi:hypothetical protein